MELTDFPFVSSEIPERYKEEPRKKFVGNWLALAKPKTDEDVSALLRFANERNIPVVPYGGGTGLVGGQIYPEARGAICLSLEKMDDILIEGDTVLVGAGVILDNLHAALEGAPFHFPLSLASSGSTQIGGLISTNAGGINVIRYGNMGENVLGLRAILADGRTVDQTRNLRKDNTGYQLDRMMIGAEGSLGIVTKARLRLVKRDPILSTVFASVSSPETALEVLEILKSGDAPINGFELISQMTWQIREEGGYDATPLGTPDWSIIVEVAGEIEAFENAAEHFLDAVVASNETQRDGLWQMRETIPLANRVVGGIVSHDISLPLESLPEFINDMPKILGDIDDLRINCFGHMGDGNLHYNLFPAKSRARDSYDVPALSMAIYRKVVELGGSISAEHGIGRTKGKIMRELGQGEKLDLMKAVKNAFDPNGIINPGVYE